MQLPVMPLRDPIRLTARRRLMLYGVGLGLWLTGALWLVFHYYMVRQTAFGPSPHPLEHWWLSLHGLFAFATLWLLGLLWGAHIVGGWRSGRRRISGSLLLLVMIELSATGYLLYYPPNEESVSTIALLHWIVGLATPLPFLVHRFLRRRREWLVKAPSCRSPAPAWVRFHSGSPCRPGSPDRLR